jgi:hypothetical protein
MTIRFVLFVNKQGQTRLAQYYEHLSLDERRALEGEIVRKCLARTDQQVCPSAPPPRPSPPAVLLSHVPSASALPLIGPDHRPPFRIHESAGFVLDRLGSGSGWGVSLHFRFSETTAAFVLMQCSFVEHRNYKVVYRRYASLFFLVGVDSDEVRPSGIPLLYPHDNLTVIANCG